jgi:mRNA interferase MazF
MRRGDLVTVALSGDFGKPRPALVIQSDLFGDTATLTVLVLSGTLLDTALLRLPVALTADNGLRHPSQIQIDKIMTLRRDKIGAVIGRLDDETMLAVTRSLAVFLGIG